MRVLHNLVQGSPEWHAHRVRTYNASEAAAIFGQHRYLTRTELMRRLHTGVVPEVNSEQQRLFDRGHASEAFARPRVAEMIGEALYPNTASLQIDDGIVLSASYDGLTIGEDTVHENKLWNDELAEMIMAQSLSPHYYWQLEQQLLIVGAERTIFSICEDKPDGQILTMEYRPVAGRAQELIAGWRQFHADRKVFVPAASVEKVVAEPVEMLPAVLVEVEGKVAIKSNLDVFGASLRAFVAKIPAKPSTDQEFANAAAAVTALKKAEEAIDTERARALASQEAVATFLKTTGELQELARTTRLATNTLVDKRKREIKEEEIARGREKLAAFVAEANKPYGKEVIPTPPNDFPGCIKNLRNLDSLRDAIDTHLAMCQSQVLTTAARVAMNILHMSETFTDKAVGRLLMPDLSVQLLKDPEDFKNLVATRKAEHDKREAEQAEKVRREAEERMQRAQAAAAAAEALRQQHEQEEATLRTQGKCDGNHGGPRCAARECWHDAAPAAAPSQTTAPAAAVDLFSGVGGTGGGVTTAAVIPAGGVGGVGIAAMSPAVSGPPTLKLGEINQRIAPLSISAAGLEVLGFKATGEGSAKLYHEADFKPIVNAMIMRLEGAMNPVKVAA